MNPSQLFHPAVAKWFVGHFVQATPAQVQAWPLIKAGRHSLIAAPTGSGKTLAAFLAAIDDLVRQGIEGPLADATQVVTGRLANCLRLLTQDWGLRRLSPAMSEAAR